VFFFTLIYIDDQMKEVLHYEKIIDVVITDIKKIWNLMQKPNAFSLYAKWNKNYSQLYESFQQTKRSIHLSLYNSINIPSTVEDLVDLVSNTSHCMNTIDETINAIILRNIGVYINHLLTVFSVNLLHYSLIIFNFSNN